VAYVERRWDEAGEYARESLRLARELGMKLVIADVMFCLAGIAAATGDTIRAARIAAAAEFHTSHLAPEPTLASAGLHRKDIETAEASCDSEAWKQAWAAGRAMSLEEAADYALSSA
jgi:hypothetical protein